MVHRFYHFSKGNINMCLCKFISVLPLARYAHKAPLRSNAYFLSKYYPFTENWMIFRTSSFFCNQIAMFFSFEWSIFLPPWFHPPNVTTSQGWFWDDIKKKLQIWVSTCMNWLCFKWGRQLDSHDDAIDNILSLDLRIKKK